MKFLEKYDFNKEQIAEFLDNSPKKLIDAIKENKKLVSQNIECLKKIGVENYQEIFLQYHDMFLMDNSAFKDLCGKYVPEDLVEKLKQGVIVFEYL